MHLVERMTETPPNCMYCGKGNTPDPSGEVGPFLDLERDVNWDDSTYLCRDCGQAIGAQFGMLLPDDVLHLRQQIRALKEQIHDDRTRRHQKVPA